MKSLITTVRKLNGNTVIFVALYLSFLVNIIILRQYSGGDIPLFHTLFFLPLTLVESLLFSLPYLWLPRKYRRTMWPAVSLLTVFTFVNVVYISRFNTFMPYTTMFWVGNFDAMVIEASLDSVSPTALTCFTPLIVLIALKLCLRHWKVKDCPDGLMRHRVMITIITAAAYIPAQTLSAIPYRMYCLPEEASDASVASISRGMGLKFKGESLDRPHYLRYNGLLAYMIWNLGDFSPSHTLTEGERQRILAFRDRQKSLDDAHPLHDSIPDAKVRRPNLLILMVESLEAWPIGYSIDGVQATPVLDSLLSQPRGSLFWSGITSQISVGTSSDGHLMTITGLLPLRDYAVSEDFATNSFPSLFDAFNRLGYYTFEITGDRPEMWNQVNTYKSWGFRHYQNISDVDPERSSSWKTRDIKIGEYVEKYITSIPQPWAGMAVTLSLHYPYREDKLPDRTFGENAPVDQQARNYLNIVHLDDSILGDIIAALKKAGIYDNTIIAITGDHMAMGLSAAHRPADIADRPGYIPLIILNAPVSSMKEDGIAAQADIYPTLLDACGLKDYPWRGVGLSLLRHSPRGAVNRAMQTFGNPSADEIGRQREAWEVSRLIITSNYPLH